MGGDRPSGHRTPPFYHQAHLLLGTQEEVRVRYDRIVDFEPFDDGLELMPDAQTAKPQAFRTGDGWLAYNLAVNLAQM